MMTKDDMRPFEDQFKEPFKVNWAVVVILVLFVLFWSSVVMFLVINGFVG